MARVISLPFDNMREARIQVSKAVRERKLDVPTVGVKEIFREPVDLRLANIVGADGNTSLLEQVIIVSLVRRHLVHRVFELGTFDGRTSANIAANLGKDGEVFTIDLPAEQAGSTRLSIPKQDLRYILKDEIGDKLNAVPNVVQLYGDTASFDFGPWHNTCDLVFVDACHEYNYAKNDTEVALGLIKKRGIIIWHDYGVWVGVTRALNEFYANDPRFAALKHIRETTLCLMTPEDR